MLVSTWLPAVITVSVALIVSTVSLLYRYRQKGHPFGSWQTAVWAVIVIAVTAAPAAVALLLPRMPPAYLGAAVPAALGIRGDRLYKQKQPTEHEVWYQIVTLGVRLLLDRLEQQMETDREEWCESQVSRVSLRQLETAAGDLYSRLSSRASMKRHLARLRSHRDAVARAADQAITAEMRGQDREAERAQHSAEQALMNMLRIAYDVGWPRTAVLPLRGPSPAPK
jgi:hypothetical protein